MNDKICIYHANCTDGFTAAWAVWRSLGNSVRFIPASYGSTPPDVVGADVIIVDFSYKRDDLLAMAETARSVLVLDHHKTAEADLEGMQRPLHDENWYPCWSEHAGWIGSGAYAGRPVVLFDMKRSGAQMAWDFFHDAPRPDLVEYVADRDLWNWQMLHSREISAYISTFDQDLEEWQDLADTLAHSESRLWATEMGSVILRKQRKDMNAAVDASLRTMMIGGHKVPVVNVPHFMASEAGEMLSEGNPFAASYYDGPNGRAFSLRSRAIYGEDVSIIARSFGGGGHRHAAGFLAPIGWQGDA